MSYKAYLKYCFNVKYRLNSKFKFSDTVRAKWDCQAKRISIGQMFLVAT